MPEESSTPFLSTPFSRRSFLKGVGLVGGAAAVAGWGVSPWVGDVFQRRGSYLIAPQDLRAGRKCCE